MPPRNPELPEGTDSIIMGAAEIGDGGTGAGGGGGGASTGGTGGGFVATGGGNDTGSSAGGSTGGSSGGSGSGGGISTDKIVGQVREQVMSLREQATDRARQFAEGGKERTSTMLDDFSEVMQEAARSIDERLGDQYGTYAHRAADAVSSLAGNLRARTLEDLLDDTRSVVRKSPAIAVGTAAVLGFALVRLVKTGMDEATGSNREDRGTGNNRSNQSAGGNSGTGGTGA
jgi:ElaB/YqjD/DUF883 family membrane-anchored ribosome-binding protein